MTESTTDRHRERAEQLISQSLLDAHGAEQMQVQTLASHIAMTPDGRYRDLLETHLGETRQHAERLQKHLAKRSSRPGVVQIGYGLAQGMVGQAVAISKLPIDLARGMSPEEKLLRNARDECAAEALEVATYKAIEQIARELGDTATQRLAASIRKQEEAMLERLIGELPSLANDVVSAEVDGNSQFVASRVGALDAARSVAAMAARRVSRGSRRAARAVETDGAPDRPAGRRPVAGNVRTGNDTRKPPRLTSQKRATRGRSSSSSKRRT